MEINDLKKEANPYDLSPQISEKEFVGRTKYIDEISEILNTYKEKLRLKNIIISGDKSIGKSALLSQIDRLLRNHNFYTHIIEISYDEELDEFHFFKEIINRIFEKIAPIEDTCLDNYQLEIWNTLIQENISHESNYTERKIHFSTDYFNYINNNNLKISYTNLEKDFEVIINAIINDNLYDGIAILIDEIQEIKRAPIIIDILRKLSENIFGLVIVGAGLPNLQGNKNFEKFTRTSYPISLKSFNEDEITQLLFKPLTYRFNLSEHETKDLFHPDTLIEILQKSEGNPLHVKLLCHYMYNKFKKDTLSFMRLDKSVMDDVMEYYSSMSSYSKAIRDSLELFQKDDFDAFKFIYYYDRMNLFSIFTLENSFHERNENNLNKHRKVFFEYINRIWDYNLFNFTDNLNINDLSSYSNQNLSHIKIKFIGDIIDRIYAKYYFKEVANNDLKHNNGKSLDALISKKLSTILSEKIDEQYINDESITQRITLTPVDNTNISHNYDYNTISHELKKLKDIDIKSRSDKKNINEIRQINKKYGFYLPSIFMSQHDFSAYYYLFIKFKIKNKLYMYQYFFSFPSGINIDAIDPIDLEVPSPEGLIPYNLNDYMIKDISSYIYTLKPEQMLKILDSEISQDSTKMIEAAKDRDFNKALKYAEMLYYTNIKIRNKQVYSSLIHANDYAFCLINLNDIKTAQDIFVDIYEKFHIAKLNYAFCLLKNGDLVTSKKLYKQTSTHSENDTMSCINLAIIHDKIDITQTIVCDQKIKNVALWNAALVSAQIKEDISIPNSFIKKLNLTSKSEEILNWRVKSWIHYYINNIDWAIDINRNTLNTLSRDFYYYQDFEIDKSIFCKN